MIGTPFIIVTPFWSSDCLVLLVVLVARAGPAEFYNWHALYNCEVYITCIHTYTYMYIHTFVIL